MLAIGTKMYILFPLPQNLRRIGIVYDYLPSRRWPYHVRSDDWPEDKPGIAYTEEELEPVIPTGVVESGGTTAVPPQ